MQTNPLEFNENIYTVSRLNNEVRFLLEESFPFIWVEGEISNLKAPHSGHWYFSLKDSLAQVRCAMFRSSQRKLNFAPKDGMHVLVKAHVSLYENRGDFQLIVEDMEERGEGKLQRAFLILKKKLEEAGLFASIHKKGLPLFPKQIGVITSSTGAAIRDILHVLNRRFTVAPVIIYPTLVQGEEAAANIAKCIEIANRRNECDVLILARGGGSLEDLWCFNEEIVANAIFQSKIPIISGVGHEIDFTISDFVADVRAPTPSVAAEMVSPDKTELLQLLNRYQRQFMRHLHNKLTATHQQLAWIKKHLEQQHPKKRLQEKMQKLDIFEITLAQLQFRQIDKLKTKLNDLDIKLHRKIPIDRIHRLYRQVNLYEQRFKDALTIQLNQKHMKLANYAAKLDALSPLSTLNRGYAIVTKKETVVRKASDVKKGDDVRIRLLEGSLECKVERIDK